MIVDWRWREENFKKNSLFQIQSISFFLIFSLYLLIVWKGKPSPSVNWFRAGRLIDSTYTTGPHGLVRNELNLRNLNRSDFMSILTCRASNNNVTEPISSTVILDMNRKSPFFLGCYRFISVYFVSTFFFIDLFINFVGLKVFLILCFSSLVFLSEKVIMKKL